MKFRTTEAETLNMLEVAFSASLKKRVMDHLRPHAESALEEVAEQIVKDVQARTQSINDPMQGDMVFNLWVGKKEKRTIGRNSLFGADRE